VSRTSQHHATLPLFASTPTAFCFDSACSNLIVATAWPDQQLYIYDVELKSMGVFGAAPATDDEASGIYSFVQQCGRVTFSDAVACVSGGNKHKKQNTALPGTVVGLLADSANPSTILAWGHHFLAEIAPGANAKITTRCGPLMCVSLLAPATVLMIERPWTSVIAQLPDAIVQSKYGT
jgi:hypothetical protein